MIELLMVIAIASIIVGLTAEAFIGLEVQRDDVWCIGALKSVGEALRQYRIDFGAYPPPPWVDEYATPAHQGTPVAVYGPLDWQDWPSDQLLLKQPYLEYSGAMESLVKDRLLTQEPVCPTDPAHTSLGNLPAKYSTYSIFYNYWGYDENGNPYPYRTRLTADLSASEVTSMAVADASKFPASGQVLVDSEGIAYSSRTNTSLNGLTRGVNGTAAADHTAGASVLWFIASLPPGIPTWEMYPRLSNPDAPDTTIVTRCPYHARGGGVWTNVLRLGGDVITISGQDVATKWLPYDGIGYPFQYQPEKPGSP